jgi:DNA-binding Xre family transcriptional regulator
MQEAEWPHVEMAQRLGISHPTLNRLMAGTQNTSLRVIEDLSRALRCKPGDLRARAFAVAPSAAEAGHLIVAV